MTAQRHSYRRESARASGFALIEVLITFLVISIGILGFAGFQTRATTLEFESYQRGQAILILEDMRARMRTNAANAADYVANNIGRTGPSGDISVNFDDCPGEATMALRDRCEWGRLLRGAAELDAADNNVGAMINAFGCITNPATNVYVIAVVWQGVNPTGAPANGCGLNQFGNENLRRAVTTTLQVPTL